MNPYETLISFLFQNVKLWHDLVCFYGNVKYIKN